jgi:hypothetical protein
MTLYYVETDADLYPAMVIATEALHRETKPSIAGRLGVQFALSYEDAQTVRDALTERSYATRVTRTR